MLEFIIGFRELFGSFTKDRLRIVLGFCASLIYFIFTIVYPGVVTEEQGMSVLLILCAYMLGEAFEGVRINDKLSNLLKSQKFWYATIGLFVTLLKVFYPDFPVDDSKIFEFAILVSIAIGGSGIAQFSLFGKEMK